MKTYQDAVGEVYRCINNSGVMISETVIKLILDEYSHNIRENLINSSGVELSGIGVLEPYLRRVNTNFSGVVTTSKVSVKLSPEFKSDLTTSLINC